MKFTIPKFSNGFIQKIQRMTGMVPGLPGSVQTALAASTETGQKTEVTCPACKLAWLLKPAELNDGEVTCANADCRNVFTLADGNPQTVQGKSAPSPASTMRASAASAAPAPGSTRSVDSRLGQAHAAFDSKALEILALSVLEKSREVFDGELFPEWCKRLGLAPNMKAMQEYSGGADKAWQEKIIGIPDTKPGCLAMNQEYARNLRASPLGGGIRPQSESFMQHCNRRQIKPTLVNLTAFQAARV